MSIKLISTHGETTTVNAFKLTCADAFRYSLKSNGLFSGLVAFFLGRKVRLAEVWDNANIPTSIRKTMFTLLKDRNIEPLEPEVKMPNAESLRKEEAEIRYNTYTKLQEDIASARRTKTVWKNANTVVLENIYRKEKSLLLTLEHDLKEAIKKEDKNKEEIQSVLSRAMGQRLCDNNPALADLNNPNRPQKLAEKLKFVYEREWTDLFEALNLSETKPDGQKNCTLLLDILHTVHDEMKSLVTLTLEQKANEYGSEDFHSMDITSRDEIIKTVVAEYDKKELEIEKKLFNKVKETVLKDIAMTDAIHESLMSYIKPCAFLIYLAFISKPPLLFTFKKEGDTIDMAELKTYTMTGSVVNYMIWPTIFLYEGGPVLSRGVVQPKHFSDKKT